MMMDAGVLFGLIFWLCLAWCLLAAPLGVLIGKMIKRADERESLASGPLAEDAYRW